MVVNKNRASDLTEPAGAAPQLAELARHFYARGWAVGTSGNFSCVLSEDPLRIAITATGRDKGQLHPADIVEIDGNGELIREEKRSGRRHTMRSGVLRQRPSDEAKLHLAIVRARHTKAVLHTHSVWATIVSERYAARQGLSIKGYEMLKGLEGVCTHEHSIWVPILENSQDVTTLAATVTETLVQYPGIHGFLLRRHGLYTWGRDLAVAKRHVEILEFLIEVVGRSGG